MAPLPPPPLATTMLWSPLGNFLRTPLSVTCLACCHQILLSYVECCKPKKVRSHLFYLRQCQGFAASCKVASNEAFAAGQGRNTKDKEYCKHIFS